MKVYLAKPRGFCAGVSRAVSIVERALLIYGRPIYVRHEIVHNRTVVDDLRSRGAVFINELSEVPDGATVVFSAHGVPKSVEEEAARRGFRVFDATCPLVTKVHREVVRHREEGRSVVMIGHRGHPEVESTIGQVGGGMHLVQTPEDVSRLEVEDPERVAYVTQTTLCVEDCGRVAEALRRRFPGVVEPRIADICYATQRRQDAVRRLAREVGTVIVIGSRNSSNSNRLREVAEKCGARAFLADSAADIDDAWVMGCGAVGVTAGASAPERLVAELVRKLSGGDPSMVVEMEGEDENMSFPLPKGLWSRDLDRAGDGAGRRRHEG